MSLTLRTISREQHLAYIQTLPSASHCQVPAWADVKTEWRSENLGWFDKNGELVGAGLVLYRQLPKIKRYLAYLPEGPVINWYAPNLDDWLQPMLAHLKNQGAFSVKMGPPVVIRRWDAPAIKAGIQDPDVKRLPGRGSDAYRAARVRSGGPAAEDGLAAGRGRRCRLR
ncbi:lipid II:glycine glycyltransferase (peptidoglycan interpeptide bridge formation enzyme) [Streptomyces pristinaespiralis]